jgi:hypothetical protein
VTAGAFDDLLSVGRTYFGWRHPLLERDARRRAAKMLARVKETATDDRRRP